MSQLTLTPGGKHRYRNAVVATSPVAYWRLGEPSGIVARDEMGAFPGQYDAGPALGVAGLIHEGNAAVRFDGTAGKRMRAVAALLTAATTMSFAFWMDCDAVQPGNFRNPFGNQDALFVGFYNVQPTNGLFGRIGGTADFMLSPGDVSGRHMFAFTLNAAGLFRSWRDGIELVAGLGQPTAHTNVTVSELRLGESGGGTNPSVATMDEVAIWNRVLTPAEIVAMYALGNA